MSGTELDAAGARELAVDLMAATDEMDTLTN
jgi:hypothetical protein